MLKLGKLLVVDALEPETCGASSFEACEASSSPDSWGHSSAYSPAKALKVVAAELERSPLCPCPMLEEVQEIVENPLCLCPEQGVVLVVGLDLCLWTSLEGCFLPDAPRLCPWLLILVPFLRIVLGLALTLSMYVSTVEYILPRLVAAVGSRMPPQLPALKASPWSLVRHGTGDAAQEVLVLGVVPLQDVQDVRELL